jgi:hypothetical protein
MIISKEDSFILFSAFKKSNFMEAPLEGPGLPFVNITNDEICEDEILVYIPERILDCDLTLFNLTKLFGFQENSRCVSFYNQDWYLNEKFAHEKVSGPRWVRINTQLYESSRGQKPDSNTRSNLLSAAEYSYIFFASYLKFNVILWKYDYVWTKDTDSHGDQIYVGRYFDETGLVKSGFSIHRHLSIKNNYGIVSASNYLG